jgi:hypothetical protein
VFLNAIIVSKPVENQLKMANIQSDQAPAKRQKTLKTLKCSSMKTITKQSVS